MDVGAILAVRAPDEWARCDNCGSWFQDQLMWSWLGGPWVHCCGTFRYACLRCAPRQADARLVAEAPA